MDTDLRIGDKIVTTKPLTAEASCKLFDLLAKSELQVPQFDVGQLRAELTNNENGELSDLNMVDVILVAANLIASNFDILLKWLAAYKPIGDTFLIGCTNLTQEEIESDDLSATWRMRLLRLGLDELKRDGFFQEFWDFFAGLLGLSTESPSDAKTPDSQALQDSNGSSSEPASTSPPSPVGAAAT